MDKTILVSVVIPIYNSEEYLQECLDSVRTQTWENIEIILINDGSKDNSLEICKYNQQLDERIIVISQENSGVSTARNKGMDKASGDFIIFVDSDDICDRKYVEELLNNNAELEEDSLVIAGLRIFDSKGNESTINFGDKIYKTKEYVNDILVVHNINRFCGGPYGKLFSKKILIENKLYFDTSMKYAEDFCFNMAYLRYVSKVRILNSCLYSQRADSSGSLSASNFKKGDVVIFWEQRRKAFTAFVDLLNFYDAYTINKKNVCSLLNAFLIATEKYCCKYITNNQECYNILCEIRNDALFEKNLYVLGNKKLLDCFRVLLFKIKAIRILICMEKTRYSIGKKLGLV